MTIIILTAIFIAILALLALIKIQQLKAKARKCSKEAKLFHDKLQQLTMPDHFFKDEEVHLLKREFAPLLDTVNNLYDSMLISKSYLDDLGLNDFLEERILVNHSQFLNNNRQLSPK